jgi:hypothetical protein
MRTKDYHPNTNGFVGRLHKTVKEELFETALREAFYEAESLVEWSCASLGHISSGR